MSPEQARGLAPDARSDIYACGVLLYALVTGRVPFSGDEVGVALRHMNEPPAPPSAVRAGVPPRLERAILRAMEKDPLRRPQTARALRAELAPALMDDSPMYAWKDEETIPEMALDRGKP
jgi:serine/threonine-protein kinase